MFPVVPSHRISFSKSTQACQQYTHAIVMNVVDDQTIEWFNCLITVRLRIQSWAAVACQEILTWWTVLPHIYLRPFHIFRSLTVDPLLLGGGIELQWAVNCDMRRDQDGKKGESTGFHWLFRIKYTVYPANVCWSWWMCDTNPDWHRSGFSTDICGKHEMMESTSSRFYPQLLLFERGDFFFFVCVVLHFLVY